MKTRSCITLLLVLMIMTPVTGFGAAITDNDSTQPRGAPTTDEFNKQGLHLGPIVQGFRAPAFRAKFFPDDHFDWKGMPMANIMRDPSQYAMLGVSNRDMILYINSLEGNTDCPGTPLYEFLKAMKLLPDVQGTFNHVKPTDLLPITADLCNRCHSPVGWMEAHSEPPTEAFPFLKGQFWAAAFHEFPGHIPPTEDPPRYWAGERLTVQLKKESEAEMDGIQCDFCHRQYANFKKKSQYDGSIMSNGNGGFFVNRFNVLRNNSNELPDEALKFKDPFAPPLDHGGFQPYHQYLHSSELCGTCHDVTNPLLKTQTKIKDEFGREFVPDIPQPIERTYTEWYWSGYRQEGTQCIDCHAPMKFQGQQTWLLTEGMDKIWEAIDRVWPKKPYNYPVEPFRTAAFEAAKERNIEFLRSEAADVEIELENTTDSSEPLGIIVKVTNNAGHKLPTGYPEGRQMWIHIKVETDDGDVLLEDGVIDEEGKLVRTERTKVYEAIPIAEGYEDNLYRGFSILDANKDGVVTHKEKEFHFVLNNVIDKDNRIPPKGFNKAAYMADGAFIVPRDPQDNDYEDGQNWDETRYEIDLPAFFGKVKVTATLKFQTFSKEFMDFLRTQDKERTVKFGGRARNVPDGPYQDYKTWGKVMYDVWKEADFGRPVDIAESSAVVLIRRNNILP